MLQHCLERNHPRILSQSPRLRLLGLRDPAGAALARAHPDMNIDGFLDALI